MNCLAITSQTRWKLSFKIIWSAFWSFYQCHVTTGRVLIGVCVFILAADWLAAPHAGFWLASLASAWNNNTRATKWLAQCCQRAGRGWTCPLSQVYEIFDLTFRPSMSHQAIRSSIPQLRKRRIAKKKLLRRGTPLKEGSNGEQPCGQHLFVFVVIGQSPPRIFTAFSRPQGPAGGFYLGPIEATCLFHLFSLFSGRYARGNIDFWTCVGTEVWLCPGWRRSQGASRRVTLGAGRAHEGQRVTHGCQELTHGSDWQVYILIMLSRS